MVFILSLAAVITAAVLFLTRPQYPGGMYAMYDESGTVTASLVLRTDGTYRLDDRQNYSSYGSGTAPLLVFAHDFHIGQSGLSWNAEESGRLHRSGQKDVYLLKGFLGGLFSEKKDVLLLNAGSVIYFYDADGDDDTVWMMSRIS